LYYTGTAIDINVSEVMEDRTLRHIARESCQISGVPMDTVLWKFVEGLVPDDKKEALASHNTEILDIQREIERKIRHLSLKETGQICLKLGALSDFIDIMSDIENVTLRRQTL